MAHLVSGRTRALALPVGLALTASLGVLPGVASAAPAAPGAPAAVAADGPQLSYVVNTRGGRGTVEQVGRAVERAGGTVVIAYDRIGVIVVRSANPDFAETIRRSRGVQSAGATRTNPIVPQATTDIGVDVPLTAAQERAAAAVAADDQDPMEPLQWALPAIKADQAHRRTQGSARVTVAVIDTGVDDTHPDLAPNFDRAASANCASGAPDTTEGAWRPKPGESDHGTHVAGTVAAAKNGVGVTGVAPGVKVSGIKVADPGGFFYTEAVVCGFVWAADHGADVTNNSYYTDPWLFNCKDDPDQGALVESVRRAALYAERKGAVNVAAAGNASDDLAADTLTDTTSPNDTTPGDRSVNPARCPDIPTMLPGVVTVSATGAKGLKASYSNYGNGVVDVAAPGGDSTTYQRPEPPATSGLILSTLPGGRYGYKAGTSMASPHVAGVVALIRSRHPYASPAAVKALLALEADAKACGAPYDIDGDGTVDAVCEGGEHRNGFYGTGVVDALDAVRR
ncbi:S8 family serine peptidase [Streptomyces sp. NPDC013181]|uniref:S8 family peptidase n=1 Tax=Streptomyces sp. NPDC013181 TaxID=3364864 RepID=UPI0036AD56B8